MLESARMTAGNSNASPIEKTVEKKVEIYELSEIVFLTILLTVYP